MCVCGCFIGAWEWEHLQEALEEKLKNTLAVAQLMERIRSLIGKDRVSSLMFESSNTSYLSEIPLVAADVLKIE